MDTKVLVAYPAEDPPARAVAEAIAAGLADASIEADVAGDDSVTDITAYGALILGTPRDRDSALHPPKLVWIEPEQQQAVPVAVFGLESRPLGARERAESCAQLEHALTHMPWIHPALVTVFSSAQPEGELLDGDAIRAWAHELPGVLELPVPAG